MGGRECPPPYMAGEAEGAVEVIMGGGPPGAEDVGGVEVDCGGGPDIVEVAEVGGMEEGGIW